MNILAQYYDFRRFGNVTKEDCVKSVRKIINEQYHTGSAHRLHDSTLELIANATFLRWKFIFVIFAEFFFVLLFY